MNLLRLFRRPNERRDEPTKVARNGYICVSERDDAALRDAQTDQLIRNPTRAPPWIVVFHDLSAVHITRWPSRLWRVRMIDPATDADQASRGGRPLPYAEYTRCVAVHVEEELPASSLFGADGEAVVEVLDFALSMTSEEAALLASNRHRDADEVKDKLWQEWLRCRGLTNVHGGSLAEVLQFSTSHRSPVGDGLKLLHGTVYKRAVDLVGDDAIAVDEDEAAHLTGNWAIAARALADAALAYGTVELLDDQDRDVLIYAWSALRK